jgi:hypothetical protein
MLYASKGVHTLFTDQSEKETERERKREGERERGTGREKEVGRERFRICPELLFLFLKGMTGALSPFCYLVAK